MVLFLDHQQRLNLHALLGAQRANVAEMRMFWRLQDLLDLTESEREQISYRVATVNNMELPSWDKLKSLPAREFEVSEVEAVRIKRAIEEWPQFFTAADRLWLEPLLEQLASVNLQPAPR